MKTTGIFRPFKPAEDSLVKDAAFLKELTGMDIIFLRDSNGEQWHEAQYGFDSNTLKVMFDENDVIIMFSEDATHLNPVNCAVAEVKKSDVPAGLDVLQNWMFRDGKIIPRLYTKDELVFQAENQKRHLAEEASAIIAPLQDAVDLNLATDEEIALLAAWKRYRVLLNRIDTQKAPELEWPERPNATA